MKRFNHAMTLAFPVISEHEEEPAIEEVLMGLELRIQDLLNNPDELREALYADVFDTREMSSEEILEAGRRAGEIKMVSELRGLKESLKTMMAVMPEAVSWELQKAIGHAEKAVEATSAFVRNAEGGQTYDETGGPTPEED